MRSGSWLKPRDSGIGGQRHSTSPATCSSSGQPLTPIVSAKLGAADDVVAGQHVLADQPARLADAELRRDLEQVGVLEAGNARAQEAQVVDRLAPALDLARRERARIGAVDRRAVGVLQLRDVDAPLAAVALRPHDRAAAREAELAGRLGLRPSAPGIVRHASPARASSTWPTRNIRVGKSSGPPSLLHRRRRRSGRGRRRPSSR